MLARFLSPKSIAVVGASHDTKKLGYVFVKNLITFGFRGKVFPVNPKGGKLFGKKVFTSVTNIPHIPDMAVLVIPAPLISGALHECGKKKVRSVVIISAGFSETGKEGIRREHELLSIAKKYRIRLLGPNCLGLIVPKLRMNASFAEGMPGKGSIAVVSQSGAMAVALTDWAKTLNVGFSALVSLGNKIDVDEEDLLTYFAKDRNTRVIIMYLESLRRGRSFLRTIKKITSSKPVIILKPGISTAAQKAVLSHTGAIAGTHAVESAALSQAGAVVVQNTEELFRYATLFQRSYALRPGGVVVLTNAGGPGILAADACAISGLPLGELHERTQNELTAFLPETASVHNPVDVVGDAPASRYERALSTIAKDRQVSGIITVLTHQYVTETEKIAHAIVHTSKKFPRLPIIASFIGGKGVENGRAVLRNGGVPDFPFPEQAAHAFLILQRALHQHEMPKSFSEVDVNPFHGTQAVLGKIAEKKLAKYVPDPLGSILVHTPEQAIRAARRISFPVVAKVIHKKLLHKSDRQAVVINIISEQQLKRLLESWKALFPWRFGNDEGYLIQPYVAGGLEIFIGAKRDPLLGPYMVIGIGGVYVESFRSPHIELLPITHQQAESALTKGLLGNILGSARGKALAKNKLKSVMLGVSRMMLENPTILECDINPVLLFSDRVALVDVRLIAGKR